jgi:hypothetical protein
MDNTCGELYAHCVAAHADYPILIYAPNHDLNGVDNDDTDIEDEEGVNENEKKSIIRRKRSIEGNILRVILPE